MPLTRQISSYTAHAEINARIRQYVVEFQGQADATVSAGYPSFSPYDYGETPASLTRMKKSSEKPEILNFLETGVIDSSRIEAYTGTAADSRPFLVLYGSRVQGTEVVFTIVGSELFANSTRTNHIKAQLVELAQREGLTVHLDDPRAWSDDEVGVLDKTRVLQWAWRNPAEIDDTALVSQTTMQGFDEAETDDTEEVAYSDYFLPF